MSISLTDRHWKQFVAKYRCRRLSRFRRGATLQDPQPGVGNVPVYEGAQDVAHIAIRVIVASTSMDEAQVVEGEHVAGRGLEAARVLVGQTHKGGHGLIPGTHLLQRHAEVAVALRNAVVDPHKATLGIQAVRD